jgi:pimeloyl-ACP methyl ester carboxylesterase
MSARPQWLTLPITPTLPKAWRSGYAPINGIRIWYALFGQGNPVLLLHGGLANSDYWGNQVPVLARHYQVIVMDSRGHGRSTRDQQAFSHRLMASDVIGLMDFLKIRKAAIVGWSEAINHPDRLTTLFAFASDTDPNGLNDLSQNDVFNAYIARTRPEYEKLSSTPSEYDAFLNQINKMWMSRPILTAEQLASIRVPVWVVDGDHEEAVSRENTLFIFDNTPRAAMLIQPAVSHFSFLQDPHQFNDPSNLKLQQPQLPRSNPDGQPTESSKLGHFGRFSDPRMSGDFLPKRV